jgi:hypothetical protein
MSSDELRSELASLQTDLPVAEHRLAELNAEHERVMSQPDATVVQRCQHQAGLLRQKIADTRGIIEREGERGVHNQPQMDRLFELERELETVLEQPLQDALQRAGIADENRKKAQLRVTWMRSRIALLEAGTEVPGSIAHAAAQEAAQEREFTAGVKALQGAIRRLDGAPERVSKLVHSLTDELLAIDAATRETHRLGHLGSELGRGQEVPRIPESIRKLLVTSGGRTAGQCLGARPWPNHQGAEAFLLDPLGGSLWPPSGL